ncbi:MAG TPA: carboxypeptidase-like regulatory domain-containing protein [Acidobacteriaceae bacterium]|nr:carboxypeptidase-like regulatory domain-containing protein [Acidobacteriaceae bacterium]
MNKFKGQVPSHPRLLCFALTLLLCCLASLPCSAQSSANLYGTVTDAGGAAIPSAKVKVTDVATGVVTNTVSDSSGNYSFPSLAPAGYAITVEAPGFKTEELKGITLAVNQNARQDVKLQIGSVDSTVEVTTAAPLVDTSSASVGTVIGQRETVDLPLNVRRFGALATLVPGTVPDQQGGTTGNGFANSNIGSPFSEETYSANGARSSSNNTLIDGADSRNLTFGGFAVQPSPDAVQEFKIQTNIYDAAFGKTAGSTINLITKSGSNEFHGSVYDFLRNDALDASNYFNPVKPELRRNQYGASIGGPVIRSKHMFFFANYEGLRETQGKTLLSIVPTDAQRAGNMSNLLTGTIGNLCGAGGPAQYNYDTGQIFDPKSETNVTCPSGTLAGQTILVGTPVPGNIITTIDPVALHVFSLHAFPEPNISSATGNNYINSAPLTRDDHQGDARFDWDKSEKNQIFGRYILGQANISDPSSGYNTLPGFGDTLYFRGQNVAIGWTHTFGPRLLNEALFGFQRDTNIENCASCPRPSGYMEAFGVQGLAPLSASLAGFPIFGFSNGTSGLGDSNYRPVISPDMIEKYQDTVTYTKGRQTMVFGADIQPWQVFGEEAPFSPHGELDFNGQYSALAGELNGGVSTGSDFADFLQGAPHGGNRTLKFENTNQVGGEFDSVFFQDNVKLTPNLSINAGVRWEFRRWATDKHDNYVTLVPTGAKFAGPGNALLVTAAPAAQNDAFCANAQDGYLTSNSGECLIATSAQRSQLGFKGRTVQTLIHPVYHDFAPRFGIVFRPTASDKLIVRSGYGIFYDLPNFNNQHFVDNNPVFSPSQTFTTTQGDAPIATSQTIFAGSGAGIPKLTDQFVSLYVAPHYLAPYFQQWSLGIQSQLSTNWAMDLAYIGTRGLKLGNLHLAGNQAEPGTTALQSRRPYVDFGTMLFTTSDGASFYNSLQFKINRRFTNGLSVLGAYTWAKALDNSEGDEGFGAGAANSNLAQDDNNLAFEWSRSYSDARHRVVANAVYDLPFGRNRQFLNQGGIVGQVVGGWEVSGITSVQTGYPFGVLGPDFSNTGSDSPRPNRVCSGIGAKQVTNWFNTSCFVAAGSTANPVFGNSKRNILDAPGQVNTDMTVMRHFNVWDKADVVFRGEFFNAFNHPFFGAPANNINNPTTAGHITSATDGRQIQLALKILF